MRSTTRNMLGAAVIAAATLGGFQAVIVAPAQAAPITAPVRTQQPGLGDLQSKLRLVLDTGASRSARAAELEAGEAGLPLMDQIGSVINTVPSLRWVLAGPVNVNGDTTTANLQVTVDGYGTFPNIELTWREIDGSWKLTRDSECSVAYYAGLGCNL
ncbi:hypothetical protein D7D52_28590 [Nocardia yunnanensis]|uniref:Low molecular weight antigen MTB12-like C-terminal domain-containing protein n=1 Tax=Nocardia yunnanensis TaxID=2382165 RepID=A0A386ZHU5_9NOCA|nr:hypothetical protein [Nocardia yunnanensis]AYF77117.1 hypothetical protein D7D52_28590 [Nocardia yunnanensis]